MKLTCLIAVILYICGNEREQELCQEDLDRNLKWENVPQNVMSSEINKLCFALTYLKEYRSIFYYRMRRYKKMVRLSQILLPDLQTIEIGGGKIGGGFMVSHYYSVVYPKEAGKNLRIGPGVVVGRSGPGFPQIGNNVYLGANVTVIGDITIGDNVIVGAGSVVTKSLPGNGVYIGNPARFLKPIDNDPNLLKEIM